MKDKKMRSPLSGQIPRLPGMYVREKKNEIIDTFVSGELLILGLLIAYTLQAWLTYYIKTPSNPWTITNITIVFAIFTYYRFYKVVYEAKNYAVGSDGEVQVGQIFEGLRPYGYTPIHDVPCRGANGKLFNIDHVLVGPKGIFAVETKTWRKVSGENEKVSYRNNNIFAGLRKRGDRDIIQASGSAKWLNELLTKRIGINHEVFPILTFPGWYVEQEATSAIRDAYGVYALNPKVIGTYLDGFATVFSDTQIQQVVASLSQYVYERVSEDKK